MKKIALFISLAMPCYLAHAEWKSYAKNLEASMNISVDKIIEQCLTVCYK